MGKSIAQPNPTKDRTTKDKWQARPNRNQEEIKRRSMPQPSPQKIKPKKINGKPGPIEINQNPSGGQCLNPNQQKIVPHGEGQI
jgi:hypothetical protein